MNDRMSFLWGRGTYKNFDVALEGFAESGLWREGYLLRCTGKGFTPQESKQIARWGLASHVLALRAVSKSQLDALYANAYCLLYPSLFEGFGMPVLEAMRSSCPVVAANRSVIPEIAGDAALLVDVRSPHAVAVAMHSLSEPNLRRRLIDRGLARALKFTWDRSAERHAAIYRWLVDDSRLPDLSNN